MKPTVDQLETLLALKRHESPGTGYWQDFLCEFHHRQREEAVEKSTLGGLWGRLSGGLADLGASKWIYGAGLGYAALTLGFFLTPRGVDHQTPSAVPVHRQVPAAEPVLEQLQQLDLGPASEGQTGEQVF